MKRRKSMTARIRQRLRTIANNTGEIPHVTLYSDGSGSVWIGDDIAASWRRSKEIFQALDYASQHRGE